LRERSALVAEARAIMRAHFEAADAGITGATFLVAETGTAIVVTNEGNGDLTRLLPRTHIVVTGPSEFHVVLLDNGRSRLLNSPVAEVLNCIRCGACLNHCPVYGTVGGHAYGSVYPGPIGAALMPGLAGLRQAQDLPQASSFCGRCEAVCPVKIPLTRIMRHWRNEAFSSGLTPWRARAALRLWAFLARRPRLYRRALRLATILMRRMGRGGRIRSLPAFRGWFAHRDLAVPARRSFQNAWRARR
jgi:L-lactate dehydrogenase complex protein LldF